MAYRKGMLRIKDCPYDDYGPCWAAWEKRGGREKEEPLCDLHGIAVGRGEIFLPHSCDEWVIGGPKEITDLVLDLMAALYKLNPEHAVVVAAGIQKAVAFAQLTTGIGEAFGPKKEKV